MKPVKKTKAEEPELEPLCCCEYIDRNGEKNHVAACLCDCQDLDEGLESKSKFTLWEKCPLPIFRLSLLTLQLYLVVIRVLRDILMFGVDLMIFFSVVLAM